MNCTVMWVSDHAGVVELSWMRRKRPSARSMWMQLRPVCTMRRHKAASMRVCRRFYHSAVLDRDTDFSVVLQ
jgi:hypothetical protein